jgi:hypothetical protein
VSFSIFEFWNFIVCLHYFELDTCLLFWLNALIMFVIIYILKCSNSSNHSTNCSQTFLKSIVG